MAKDDLILKYLRDAAGNVQATGDYSAAPTAFFIEPPGSAHWEISRMIVHLRDDNGFSATSYGREAALTNGITVRKVDAAGKVTDLTDGVPIISCGGWARLCYDANILSWGARESILAVRWTFALAGLPLSLQGKDDERLEVVLNDDLSQLSEHTFMAQGVEK